MSVRDGRSAFLSTGALTGNLIGPLVGGVLPNLIGIRNTFFAGGAVIAIAMFVTIFLVKEDHREITPMLSVEDSEAISQRLQPSVRIIVGAMLATAMLVLLANMSIEPIITVYLEMLKLSLDGFELRHHPLFRSDPPDGEAASGLGLHNARTRSAVSYPDVIPSRTSPAVPGTPSGTARLRPGLARRTPDSQ